MRYWHFSLPAAVGLRGVQTTSDPSTVEEVLAALVSEARRLKVPRNA